MHDLRLLSVLREVALRGSFSAAAEALDYTQPAVSQQIARLEKQVGVKLIEREPRGIRLTPGGEVLVRHTETILAQVAAAEAELGDIAEHARGRLRMGAFATASGTIVPRAVAAFRKLRPAIEVELSLMEPHDSIPAVRRGDLEVAITEEGGFAGDADTSGLEVEELLEDHMWVSLPSNHPLATRRAIDLADLLRRGLDARLPDRHLRRLQRRAARLPRRRLRAARRLHLRRLLRDAGPRGQRDGRRADPRPRASRACATTSRCGRSRAARPTAASPPSPSAETVGGAVATMLECLRDAGEVYAESGLAAAA